MKNPRTIPIQNPWDTSVGVIQLKRDIADLVVSIEHDRKRIKSMKNRKQRAHSQASARMVDMQRADYDRGMWELKYRFGETLTADEIHAMNNPVDRDLREKATTIGDLIKMKNEAEAAKQSMIKQITGKR